MTNPIIKVQDFSFSFGKKEILERLSFEVAEGEYLSVIGPNGAGKTTLVKCLNRILTGGVGAIELAGRQLGEYSQRELAQVVSYVPQADGRLAPFSAREFVMLGRYPYFSPFSAVTSEDQDAVSAALALTGTEDLADRALTTLSGGERQKVFIAAAIAQGARVMLLDEPTTFLDPRRQAEIHATLGRLHRESGQTIISVTHDVNAALNAGDRVLALKDGKIAFHGPVNEIVANDTLESIFDVPFHVLQHPAGDQPLVVPKELP